MMKKLLAIAAAAMLLLTAACNRSPEDPQPKPDPEYPVTVGSVTLTEAPLRWSPFRRERPKWCMTWAMATCWPG